MSTGREISIEPLPAPPDVVLRLPGSKSYTNRSLVLAALADGRSRLIGASVSDDALVMIDCLRRLGIQVSLDTSGSVIEVEGAGGVIPRADAELFTANAGTATRFILAMVALGHGTYRINGSARMRERPIQPLVDALNTLGSQARCVLGNGCPPVEVQAQGLRGGQARMRGDLSSQYFSALLMVGAYTREGLCLEVGGDLVSRPYLAMTMQVMSVFGVRAATSGYRTFTVAPGQRYLGREYLVEPDATAASYFLAAAALLGGRVRIEGIGKHSRQGDIRFVDMLARMGCQIEAGDNYLEVQGPRTLRGIDADMREMPDVAPTLAAIAPFAASRTVLRGIAHLRLKETDRVAAIAAELRRLKVRVEEQPDSLTIYPSEVRPASIQTYGDHRMAMSFAIIGLLVPGIRIQEPQCVDKSFPGFFDTLKALYRSSKPSTVSTDPS